MSAIDLVRGDWEQLKLQLSQVKEPIETSATLPPMCYSNDAFFAHELRSEFHKSWIGIGRSDRWRAPADTRLYHPLFRLIYGLENTVLRGSGSTKHTRSVRVARGS